MKIAIVSLAVVLFVSAVSAGGPLVLNRPLLQQPFRVELQQPFRVERSEEDLLTDLANFKKKTFGGLKIISTEVANGLLRAAAQILTDGVRLQATPQVESAFTNASTGGLWKSLAEIIRTKARIGIIQKFPSHEGIVSDIGPFFRIPNVQTKLHFYYNESANSESPSHEGILGNLGGLALKGLGGLIGGTAGNIISGAGDLLGNIFFALPSQPGVSQEGIISKLGHAGILTGSGELILNGALKAAQDLLRSVFKPYSLLLRGPIFLARGQFNKYPNIQAPGQEALQSARNIIHHHNFSSANACIDAAELNLTQLFEQYVQQGNGCVNNSYNQGEPIVHQVFDIIIDAVGRVENAHREAGLCFKKIVRINRCRCFNVQVPAIIDAHSERFRQYGEHLAEFTKQFSDLNTQFDSCLARHLGNVRSKVYRIVSNFHNCVAQQEAIVPSNLPDFPGQPKA